MSHIMFRYNKPVKKKKRATIRLMSDNDSMLGKIIDLPTRKSGKRDQQKGT